MGSRYSGARRWVVLAFSSILLVGALGWAQEPTRSAPPTPQDSGTNRRPSSPGIHVPQNSTPDAAAKDGGESSGDDGTAQLRNSPSVKWLAHKLGVSTATGYRLSIGFNFAAMVAVIVLFLGPRLPPCFETVPRSFGQAIDEAVKRARDATASIRHRIRMLKLESEILAMQSAADQRIAGGRGAHRRFYRRREAQNCCSSRAGDSRRP